jgi:hypothetical protein
MNEEPKPRYLADVLTELSALSEPQKAVELKRLEEEHNRLIEQMNAIPRPPRTGKGSRTQRKPYETAVRDISERIDQILWMKAVLRD